MTTFAKLNEFVTNFVAHVLVRWALTEDLPDRLWDDQGGLQRWCVYGQQLVRLAVNYVNIT